jgi:DNA-binding NarL/FixJ family response regulator
VNSALFNYVVTPHETAVPRFLQNKKIDREFDISPKSVKDHIKQTLGKLGIRNLTHAMYVEAQDW